MIHLIIGGSGSGKSAYAERFALACRRNDRRLFYLATMAPIGREAERRIERHRKMREGLGFETIEMQRSIGDLADRNDIKGSVILLESLSDLLANELFEPDGSMNDTDTVGTRIFSEIMKLDEETEDIIIVSDDIFRDGIGYTGETDRYMEILGKIHIWIAEASETVTEVICGIPRARKGGMK